MFVVFDVFGCFLVFVVLGVCLVFDVFGVFCGFWVVVVCVVFKFFKVFKVCLSFFMFLKFFMCF